MTMTDLAKPPVSLLDRYIGKETLPLYTTSVTVTGGAAGHGRASGHAVSQDGELNVDLRLPAELGGKGGGTNPEQLFAAGYAACFHGAMVLVATKLGVKLPPDVSLESTVTFGRDPSDGLFLLTVKLNVTLPGVAEPEARRLISETEAICPYAKMARSGILSSVELAA
jgi:lipoyl-dependent peroxiredoxin